VENNISVETIRGMLSDFTQAYIVLKLLAITLVINVYTWRLWFEAPRRSLNFVAMNVVLLFFGVFLIPTPRYYIELEWFRFRVRRSLAQNSPVNLERDDMRPFRVRVVAWAADCLVLSGFIYSCLGLFL
jgi:hypothetical protein